ncbi:MAG: formylglycine-generating enzyme family protein [Pseudomonadota bacterium]
MSTAIDPAKHPLVNGGCPQWADGVGEDAFGPFAELRFVHEGQDGVQRLRWIPPGTFQMGAGADDREAYDREKPQHQVTLTQGYWLFDTPVTQAHWISVMDENPSKFDGTSHPVEHVSWHDAQTFLNRLNEQRSGLVLSLPTEAQWEYACRAGSDTPRYGDLRDIAWYSQNSKRKTHPVATLAPSRWGLYDMLGNVWEWCADGLRRYSEDPALNPADVSAGDARVIRGGSWALRARYVRCACRYALVPSLRYGTLGFRCARVQT